MKDRKESILVIDDEKNIRDGCKSILEDEGWQVETCEDGESGIEAVRKAGFDLALVDLKMPGLGGIEVFHAIRGIDPTILVIVITGYATVQSAVDAMKQGAYDFVAKPFSPDQLIIVVRRALEKRAMERSARNLREQLDRLRMDFVAMVSHELRSPLASVTQQLMALEQIEKIDRGRDMLHGALDTLEELRQLVEDLLDVSRIEAGRMVEEKVSTDMGRLISESVGFYSTKADQCGVSLSLDLPGEKVRALVDPKCIRRVLDNLIDNAIKYSSEGGRVSVKGCCSGTMVEIHVEDDGIGIAPENLPLVFERFYRVRGRKKKGVSGSGLGLSIVRGIVEAHGGNVEVQSEVGKGSRFKVILPL
jgi:two-component system sensor histidine kinase/response regulator